MDMDEVRRKVEEERKKQAQAQEVHIESEPIEPMVDNAEESKAIQVKPQNESKAINQITLTDVKVKIDETKSTGEQVKEVVDVMATVGALQDEDTQEVLKSAKRSEMIDEATKKVKKTQKEVIEAETEIQKVERESYEGLLETFGFFRHLPRWLLKIIVYALTPFYLLLGFVIGIPCGFVKILIENIDGIVCKYEDTKDGSKPKIRITIWILLGLAVITAICLTVLACLHII